MMPIVFHTQMYMDADFILVNQVFVPQTSVSTVRKEGGEIPAFLVRRGRLKHHVQAYFCLEYFPKQIPPTNGHFILEQKLPLMIWWQKSNFVVKPREEILVRTNYVV